MLQQSRRVLRILGFAIAAGLYAMLPQQVLAAPTPKPEQCGFCFYQTACPFELSEYDAACQTACGWWTYAGGCAWDPHWPGGSCGTWPRIVCYEPQ